ncbi:HEPN domain-containing protein [Azospirillum sp. B510]|uniref:HEPN domain-containing protein n=1 Tax=Azospirillum sp. (strain B510) TaxID=137722 RepID=UPI0011D05E1A|nr:HEPN domain-containing protein [Azospirillum sp. B510]
MTAWDQNSLPLYGCLTGIDLPMDRLTVAPGIVLRKVFVDMFGASMLAFSPPPTKKAAHPAPWVAVKGGFSFESRAELAVSESSALGGLSPTVVAWLVAAVLRLQMRTPVRLAVVGNIPFDRMGSEWQNASPYPFEGAPQQIGLFNAWREVATADDLVWLVDMLPIAVRLYHDERFFRAISVYNQAQWSPTLEMGVVLLWSALETLFGLGGEREKTKALSRAVSGYVATDRSDRDRAYQVVRDLYAKRGKVVHAGAKLDVNDVIQSFQFGRVCFRRVLIEGVLPASPQ